MSWLLVPKNTGSYMSHDAYRHGYREGNHTWPGQEECLQTSTFQLGLWVCGELYEAFMLISNIWINLWGLKLVILFVHSSRYI